MKILPNNIHTCAHELSYLHVQNMLQSHRQSMKLRSMIVNIKTKVLFKFGTSEIMCEEVIVIDQLPRFVCRIEAQIPRAKPEG